MKKSKAGSSRRRSNSSDESLDSAEEERIKDLKERDEFSDRLKKKDEGKTRKVVEVIIDTPINLNIISKKKNYKIVGIRTERLRRGG